MMQQRPAIQQPLSDVSAYETHLGVFMKECFWLIVVTERNEDEAEIDEFERRRRADGAGYLV